jgi:hypothetical protein
MPVYPKIQRPCPYIDRLASVMEGDFCQMCKRQVFDLTEMNDGERLVFMADCGGEVCISYQLPRQAAIAAALTFAAVAMPMAAAADTPVHRAPKAPHVHVVEPPYVAVVTAGMPMRTPPQSSTQPDAQAPRADATSGSSATPGAGASGAPSTVTNPRR